MNAAFQRLQPYPFERLRALRGSLEPPAGLTAIDLSIGEPRHATPAFILEALAGHAGEIARYPSTLGDAGLRQACAGWLTRRSGLVPGAIDPDRHVLPVNGTREALFAIAHCVVDLRRQRPVIVMPNPFYQIYEGAALLAGAEPWFMNMGNGQDAQASFATVPAPVWERCQLVYVCTPGNPTGQVLAEDDLRQLLVLADRHDFVVVSDECYGEIHDDEQHPPRGLLEVAARAGRSDFRRCLSFHSLSKRSSVPGLRSGFVAGDAALIERFLRYRTYHGSAMPPHHQAASRVAWEDESHVVENRRLYREKFTAVLAALDGVLQVERPAAGFYLWPRVPGDDEAFVRRLWAETGVLVLPGSFLARTAHGTNPGEGRVRIALTAPLAECVTAAHRIAAHLRRERP